MTERAGELRRDFDAGFAAPLDAGHRDEIELLLVRAGNEPFALSRSEVTGIHADVRIVAVPSAAPELLGLAAIRRVVVPVYALDRVVAATSAAGSAMPRWLVTVDSLALAFDRFEGFRRTVAPAPHPSRGHLRGALELDGETRAHLDIPALLATLQRRIPASKGR